MWLSKAIEQDARTRVALRKLESLIREYKDATKLPDKSKFVSTEMRLFRPNVFWYVLFVFGFGVVGCFRGFVFETLEGKAWLELSLNVIITIFVLGVTITTLAKSFSESVKFAGEYFNEVCRMELYSCLTLLTILITVFSNVFANSDRIPTVVIGSLAGCCLGATLWCITGIAFIIRETIRCSKSSEAVKTATNYATKKLSHALVKKYYLNLWMKRYGEIIEAWCKQDCEAIQPPSRYFHIKSFHNGGGNQKEVSLNFKIDIRNGAVDYKLEDLKEIDKALNTEGAELFLNRHEFQKGKAVLGIIQYSQEVNIDELVSKVRRIANKGCRFHRDTVQESSERFWREHFNKLENALGRAIRGNDISQMDTYLESIVSVIEAVEKARKDATVRKTSDRLDKCWDLIDLYRRSLRQILLEGREIKHWDKASSFSELLIESLHEQVKQMFQNGDWATLKLIIMLVPRMYSEYEICKIGKDSILWDSRARFGSFYAWANDFFEEHCEKVDEKVQTQMRVVLHKGIISWLLIAIDSKDDELIKSLCGAAKKLVFPDKKITFSPLLLVTQHFILCGKMLEFIMEKKEGVTPSIFKLLCFDKYDHTAGKNIDYEELLKFYIESRKCDLRSILYEFSNTDWETNPLTIGGFGTPSFTFSGNIELDYMFIYLALLSTDFQAAVNTRPYDFSHYNLEEKIGKFTDIAREIDIYDYKNSKDKLLQWIHGCITLHEKQEAERIAQSQIGKDVRQNYDGGLQEGLKESIPFIDYCVKSGYIEESDSVLRRRDWHMPKEIFLKKSADNIIRQGKSHGRDIGSDANTRTVRSLIDFKDEENDEGEDIGMSLIRNDDARKKAAKDVQRAVAWLKGTGCSKDQGMIVLRGVGPDVLRLFNEDGYQPAWREEGMERGFEGYYNDYPVLHLWDARNRPLCAAMDFRGWSGLIVRPELAKENQAGKVLRIRERTPEEIKEAIGGDKSKLLRQRGYCVVELELFWKVPEKKPSQKVFLYELPTSEVN